MCVCHKKNNNNTRSKKESLSSFDERCRIKQYMQNMYAEQVYIVIHSLH